MPTRLPALLTLLLLAPPARADVFDRYANPILGKAAEAKEVKQVKRLTADLLADHGGLVPGSSGALVIVKTNNGLNAKLLVQLARQRAKTDSVPIALIERFMTYKQSDAIQAQGKTLHLYGGFQLNLEIGQVTAPEVGGDVRFVGEGDGYLEPVGNAKLYVVTKHLPGTEPKKGTKPTVGETFEIEHFNGSYKLTDDGRRSAKLTLKVDAEGNVTGEYVSEQTGRKYDVTGRVSATLKHFINFTVEFPQAKQHFAGWMFTRDGKAICGSTKLQEHEFGFYALRLEEE